MNDVEEVLVAAGECPAGGDHRWVRVVGEANVGIGEGVSCDECGATKHEGGPR